VIQRTWRTLAGIRDERLIYVVMLLMVESVYVGFLAAWPALRTPALLVPFTVLVSLHAVLHLLAPRLATSRAGLTGYLGAQCALVLAIALYTRESGLLFALYLYLALAAQSISLLGGRLRPSAIAVTVLLGVGLSTYIVLWGWADLLPFLFLAFPQEFFILSLVTLVVHQSNERKRTQQLLRELETAHRQLEQFAGQTADLARAAERQRMARELHDTLAQGLAGLILQVEAIDARLVRGGNAQAQTIVQQAMGRARATLGEARLAIDDLRETESDSETAFSGTALSAAIQEEVVRFSAASSVYCVIESNPPPTVPANIYKHTLRAVAEALSNIARHAHAQHAWVQLCEGEGTLCITVRDDGSGFDPAAVNTRNGHYGLTGLRERARLARGELAVTSAPGKGTTVDLCLPLRAVQPISELAHD
jgi:NarL family two-component system sensor histidine kinase YdfH